MRSEEGNREGRAGEHMNLKISIGSQDFAFLREYNCFLVDKTVSRAQAEPLFGLRRVYETEKIWKNVEYEYVELLFFPAV